MKEDVIIREIPEVTEHMKKVNMIPLPLLISKEDFSKQFKHYFNKVDSEFYDSDIEREIFAEYKALQESKNMKRKSKELGFKDPQEIKIKHFINNYAQRVQNLQLRDTSGKLERVIFHRSSHKDAEERRDKLNKITSFKQGLTNDQLQMLRDRQFVVMDQSKIYGN